MIIIIIVTKKAVLWRRFVRSCRNQGQLLPSVPKGVYVWPAEQQQSEYDPWSSSRHLCNKFYPDYILINSYKVGMHIIFLVRCREGLCPCVRRKPPQKKKGTAVN